MSVITCTPIGAALVRNANMSGKTTKYANATPA